MEQNMQSNTFNNSTYYFLFFPYMIVPNSKLFLNFYLHIDYLLEAMIF